MWRISRNIFVGETTADALDFAINSAFGRSFDYLIKLIGPGRLGNFKLDPAMPDDEVTVEHCVKNLAIVGDVDECIRRLQELWEITGGFGTLLSIGHDWDDNAQWQRSVALLKNEVIPALPSCYTRIRMKPVGFVNPSSWKGSQIDAYARLLLTLSRKSRHYGSQVDFSIGEKSMLDTYCANHTGSLTDTQIQFYDREGYLVLEILLAADKMAMMAKVDQIADELCVADLITDKRAASPFETRLAALFTGLTDEDVLRFGRSWWDRVPGYFDIIANPQILDAVESLIGGEIFANPVHNTRSKVPNVAAGAVPWHQNKSYWPDANANPVITVWLGAGLTLISRLYVLYREQQLKKMKS